MTRLFSLVGWVVVLAGLDLAGALFAQQYAERHVRLALALGVLTFVVLFLAYTWSLRCAQLSVVTMGWIVVLQVGLVAVDLGRSRLALDRSQWLAVLAILALQCYLIVSTQGSAEPVDGTRPPSTLARAVATASNRQAPELPTPYLDVDLRIVADRYARLAGALPGIRLHYAVTANPAPEVLALLVRCGAAFDVASPGEVAACLLAGAGPRDLSYGNTAKKQRDIAAARGQGVTMFSFDDGSELAKLTAAAPASTVCCRLRTTGQGADWALSEKFGCSPSQALELLTRASAAGHRVGLAFHVGSQQRDPGQWERPLRQAGQLQAELAGRGIELAVLNIGGGFPGTYREPLAPIEAYGREIRAGLSRHLRAPLPALVAEPGRYLVADAGVLHCEVVLVAHRHGRRWVHLDVGLFGGLAETLDEAIEYPVDTDLDGGPVGPVVLAGPTCDSVDVLYRRADYQLPLALVAGDRVRLRATGAYTATYSSVGFNGLPPLAVRVRPALTVVPRPRPAAALVRAPAVSGPSAG